MSLLARYYSRSNNFMPPIVAPIINMKYKCQMLPKFSDYFIFLLIFSELGDY
jgi:hypothetical protein